jgi:hypothetical protein
MHEHTKITGGGKGSRDRQTELKYLYRKRFGRTGGESQGLFDALVAARGIGSKTYGDV